MKILEKKDFWQLTDMPVLFPINCFLIAENQELTLIDTGLNRSAKGILNTINNIGLPLTKIILTHAHIDHVGSLTKINAAFPDAEILIGKQEWSILQEQLNPSISHTYSNYPDLTPLAVEPTGFLEDGDRINSLLIIETPGHTLGSISIFDQRHGYLVVGDLLQTRGGPAIAGDIRPLFPFPGKATWEPKIAIQSTEKILTFQPSLIACGHGDWLTDPNQQLSSLVTRAKKKLN